MTNLDYFLKVLKREGYPNPDIQSIAKMVGFNLDDFLISLKQEIGEKGVVDFCDKAIKKLSGSDGLRVELEGPNRDEYVYLHINPIDYDETENEYDVVCNFSWGESKILSVNEDGQEEYMTIQDVIDQTDMGGWSDLDELLDGIRFLASQKIYKNCGFGVYWA